VTSRLDAPVICFGDRCLIGAIYEAHIGGQVRDGHVMVRTQALVDADVDYMAEVRIYRQRNPRSPDEPDETAREFTGRVIRATPGDVVTRLDVTSMPEMQRPFAGEWSTAEGMPVPEIIWTLARDTGIPEERLDMVGFQRTAEMFEIATALDGLTIEKPFVAAGVVFTDAARITRLVERFADSRLREEFVAAGTWALTVVGAGTAWEAERLGVSRIEVALALVTLRLRFSGAHLNGIARHYDIELLRAQPRHRDIAAVRSVSGKRHWLHFIGPGSYAAMPSVGKTLESTMPQIARGTSDQLREAVRAWHRAATVREPATALGALWEAIEFYAAGTTLSATFAKSDLKNLRQAAAPVLTLEQQRRFEQLLALANDQSLMPKLEERLRSDGVPHSTQDVELLRATRAIRNDFVHGRSRASVSQQQLESALAIVNRMLVYRLAVLERGVHASA